MSSRPKISQVTVRVPATTSNLGPGFDCLGVALRIYNEVTVTRGSGRAASAIVDEAARLFFKESKTKPFAFSYSMKQGVPPSRGLGSSAAVRLGVLHGLNQLASGPFDRLSLFRLCVKLEKHPDNAAPASFGGFTVVRGGNVQRFDLARSLSFVLLIPDFEIQTSAARKILPSRVLRAAAVENCANVSAITAALVSGRYADLRGAFVDHLHQPFRKRLLPFLPGVIAAAEKAGALGAFLSGSGSTIAAVTLKSASKIGRAMLEASKLKTARVVITRADNQGVEVVKSALRNSTP